MGKEGGPLGLTRGRDMETKLALFMGEGYRRKESLSTDGEGYRRKENTDVGRIPNASSKKSLFLGKREHWNSFGGESY